MANDGLQYNASLAAANASLPFDASCYFVSSDDERVMTSIRVFVGASLALVASGLVGNALSVLVFSSSEMSQLSSNVYLLALAVSDSVYLVSVLLGRLATAVRCWYFPRAPLDLVNRVQFFCVLQQYLSDLFADYSTCLILAFTVERGLAVFYPIAFKQRCTVARARFVCAATFAVIAVCIAPYHAVMIGLYSDYNVCNIVKKHEEMFAAMYLAEMMTLRVVPVAAIALLNALIVSRVTRITRDRKRRRRHIPLLPVDDRASAPATAGRSLPAPVVDRGRADSGVSLPSNRRASLDERNLQMTIILILVSTTYVLFYLPILVHFVLSKMKRSGIVDVGLAVLDVFGNYARALHVAGFAINFLLYTLSGRVFREQLVAIVCRAGRGRRPSTQLGYARAGAGTLTTNAPGRQSAF